MCARDYRRGALLMVVSCLLFAAMGAIVKSLAQALPNEMIVFFRSAIGFAVLLPWLLRAGLRNLATTHLRWHLTRGLAGIAAMYCFFYAIAHLPLAEAVLLNYSTPLFIPVIALLWLGETVGPRVWLAVAVGFAGILLILKPGAALYSPVALIGLGAGVLAALAMVNVRHLTRTEPATRIVFYFSLISTGVSTPALAWSWETPAPALWPLLLAMGVFATLAQLLLTRAYAQAPSAQVGPFIYFTVVFAAGFAWGVWGEVPDRLSLAGIALVAIAGAIAIRYGAGAKHAEGSDHGGSLRART